MGVTIRCGREGDGPVVGVALAAAFADSPWDHWTVAADRHAERLRDIYTLFTDAVLLPHGLLWVAEEPATQRGVGASGWLLPGPSVPDEVWGAIDGELTRLAGDRAEGALAAERATVGLRPARAHLTLATVGVTPSWQRRGVGAELLRPGLAEADRLAVPCYLETSTTDNVRFYERAGFEVTGEVAIPGGPTVWAMLREPAAAGAAVSART